MRYLGTPEYAREKGMAQRLGVTIITRPTTMLN
jgi:hypothetical protein